MCHFRAAIRLSFLEFLACVVLLCSVGALLVHLVQSARESAVLAERAKNLKSIYVALQYYLRDHGSYPPAYTVDRSGRRMQSWRVLLLPYIGEETLYSLIRLDEPWDSPHNRRFWSMVPQDYRLPSPHGSVDTTNTSYLAVVGGNGAWRGSDGVKYSEIAEDKMISVVEASNSDVSWMEPRDLTIEQALAALSPESEGDAASAFSSGTKYITIDGDVCTLDSAVHRESLRELLLDSRRETEGKTGPEHGKAENGRTPIKAR